VIVLDTNVVSEPLRRVSNQAVLDWVASLADYAITAVTVGELLDGVRRMPHGRRREAFLREVEDLVASRDGRVLPYDGRAAELYANFRERRRRLGRPLGAEDGMIAAIAATNGARLATRNIKDFEGLGLELINPWGI
jgi:predicted nucleic acid-binding protein